MTNEIEHDCLSDLKQLYQAYRDVSMGRQYKRVESSDMGRSSIVEYGKADLSMIATMYNELYKTCGHGLPSDYPSVLIVNAATKHTTQRGRPVRALFL